MTYRICLAGAEANPEAVTRFRREICRDIGLDPDGPAARPLPAGSYLFVAAASCPAPIGMIELFFYDQLFRSYHEAVYSQAADLAAIAPMHELAHVRSVYVAAGQRRTQLFRYLMAAMVVAARRMGARYLTAGTGLHNHTILALHRRAGMARLGEYVVDGSPQQLSLLALEPIADRAERIAARVDLDLSAAASLRRRTAWD
jgi:GNAT superfamily N-acetyltransferase